jgi:hypothetical protein
VKYLSWAFSIPMTAVRANKKISARVRKLDIVRGNENKNENEN